MARTEWAAEVVLDSVSPAGARVTTMELTYWAPIHGEVMSYRMCARNAASNRGLPVKKIMRQVRAHPAGPVHWGKHRKGMSAREELAGWRLAVAIRLFYWSRYPILATVWLLLQLPGHKQWVNRLLWPWQWMTVVMTGSPVHWENVWRQRVHPDAQPEFRRLAALARGAYLASEPVERRVHAPYLLPADWRLLRRRAGASVGSTSEAALAVATARCARVSYLTHDGRCDIVEDLRLCRDLDGAEPIHGSPSEHALRAHHDPTYRSGPIFGWMQRRATVDPHYVHVEQGHAQAEQGHAHVEQGGESA
jgi:hypothetical protein